MKSVALIGLALVMVASGQVVDSEHKPGTAKPGQFRCVGGEATRGGALVLLAEEIKQEFLALCGLPDEWKSTVELRIRATESIKRPEDPVIMRLLEMDGIRSFLLDLDLAHGLDQDRFKRAIYSMMIYDHALRGRSIPEVSVAASPWLVDGMMEAADWKRGKSDRAAYRSLFESGGIFEIDELLEIAETTYQSMDTASKAAFRVSSGVLVMALMAQPDGKIHFQNFLREAPSFQGEMSILLSRHFPGVNWSSRGLEKLWSLQMANQGGINSLTDVMGIRQTEAALENALKLLIRNDEGLLERISLSDWQFLEERSEAEKWEAVRMAENEMVRMSYRCFPPYRTLLAEYQALLVDLSKGKTNGISERLDSLALARKHLLDQEEKGRDFLDWFEITRAHEASGAFKDFMMLRNSVRSKVPGNGRSTAKYLDAVNTLFER